MRLSTEIYTAKVIESRNFYVSHFDFLVKKEMEGFVVLQHRIDQAYEIILCLPDSPFVNQIFRPQFTGKGIIFQMEVEDVTAEYERVQALGIPIVLTLTEEPVNGHHFTITDPSGMLIDIVQFD